ncbi:MAG: hypothetical protein FJZ87_00215 [Chloroflexi bacterium]|nr:hypothetical protein [Chloroflexota bacterium]
MNLKSQIKWTMILGMLSLIAGSFGHLALTDIYHGEGDLFTEWNILRACAIVLLFFIGSALLTLNRALKAV